MSEPKQQLLLDQQPQIQRPVVYIPPDTNVFEQLAEQVCIALGEKYHPAYQEAEVVEGLTAFLTVIARLTAKSVTNGTADWLKQKSPTQREVKEGA
jgi:hypothetical protein